MSETLLVILPPTIAALAAMTVGMLNFIQGKKIHVLVNSNMSKVQSDLAMANKRIEELQVMIVKNLPGVTKTATEATATLTLAAVTAESAIAAKEEQKSDTVLRSPSDTGVS